MSKLRSEFSVQVPYGFTKTVFDSVISNWVKNYQSNTSGFVKASMVGRSGLIGILALTTAKDQGIQNLGPTTLKIQIPAAATTMGGEMTVTAKPSPNGSSNFEIDGHTLGLFGGALKTNVDGLTEYLKATLPDLEKERKRTQPEIGVSKSNMVEEIKRLSEMHDQGVLTDAEFSQAKTRVLSDNGKA
jgi:hypothetical protein